jgi:4-amino-4-deoxy-L-arabinose transferase-like glycosyltransferase
MINQVFGIITVIFCLIGFYFSWKLQARQHFKSAVILLVICGLALRLYTSSDLYLHSWDEKYHALVAKNIINHPLVPTLYDTPVMPFDYRVWYANHIWLHKQPVPLWLMAGSMWLLGVNEIALRLPSMLMTTLGIWLTFILGSYFFNRKTGYLAALFYAINGLILELTAGRIPTDHIDIAFLFFVELSVIFTILYIQKNKTVFTILAGVSLGCAILSKWLPAMIILPVWLLIVTDSGKFPVKTIIFQFSLLIFITCLVFMPWQIYIYRAYPVEAAWESSFNLRHITESLEGHSDPHSYYLHKIMINYGELIYLPLGWFLWTWIKRPDNLKRWALGLWFLIPLIFFSAIKTKMQGYLLFTSPVLFMITAEFWNQLAGWRKSFRYPALINLLLILFIVLPARYSIERAKPFDKRERNPEWVKELRALNLRETDPKTILFNYPRPVEAMFYTPLTVYQEVPDLKTIRELQEKGYMVMINDNDNLVEELRNIEGVTYKDFSFENNIELSVSE